MGLVGRPKKLMGRRKGGNSRENPQNESLNQEVATEKDLFQVIWDGHRKIISNATTPQCQIHVLLYQSHKNSIK